MKEIQRHLDAENLERYSMGSSSQEEAALIEEHLLTCECCQDRLRESDDYVLAMRRASEQRRQYERTATRREWRFPSWFPVLAAVACCILLAVIALRFVPSPGPAVAISLSALRSNGAGSGAPAGRELTLHPDLTGLAENPTYRLEIVDGTGHPVREGTFVRAQNEIKVPGLGAGLYFVRVYLPSGELLREYGLEIR